MAAIESRMLELGTTAPKFTLPDAFGKLHTLDKTTRASALLVMFICNHCPFVKHIRHELSRIGKDYRQRDLGIFAINSNDSQSHPGDSPENMKKEVADWDYVFPYLVDGDQRVAKAYQAACTPDFFVFDSQQRLVYRGQLDESRPSNGIAVTGRDLRAAVDAALAGKAAQERQIPSIGCNIKWKPGNEPDWYK